MMIPHTVYNNSRSISIYPTLPRTLDSTAWALLLHLESLWKSCGLNIFLTGAVTMVTFKF